MTTLVIASICAALYSYFIYPLVLLCLPRRRAQDAGASAELPKLSLIITVHNERDRILAKLENCVGLDYPSGRLEIIVASDGSTDGTDELVEAFGSLPVRLVRATERLGKENAQREAIAVAQGDVLVFSDVGTSIPSSALQALARCFHAPDVGAVSSEDRFYSSDGSVVGEGAYVRYEMWLRRIESERGGLVGLSGSFFAARREVCDRWDIHSPSDFNTALNCARLGYRSVSSPEVEGHYKDVADPAHEYRRKVRTVLRGMTALRRHPEALSPSNGMFAFQLWSHKIARWIVPWALLATLLLSIPLAVMEGGFWALLLGLQVLGYATVLAAHYVSALRAITLVRIGYYFTQVNVAIAHALLMLLAGRSITRWAPTRR